MMTTFADDERAAEEPGASALAGSSPRAQDAPATERKPTAAKAARRGHAGGFGFQLESVLIGLVVTAGIVGIGVALGAILTSQHVAGWIVGLVVSAVSVVLSSMLWSSRRR